MVATLGAARGQEIQTEPGFSAYYGSQVALTVRVTDTNWIALPQFGLQLGAEFHFNAWSLGARLSGSSLLFLTWYGAADAYLAYTLESGFTVYAGAGVGLWTLILPGADGASSSHVDWHGLIGLRFPNGFFLEAAPGVALLSRCSPDPSCSSLQTVPAFALTVQLGWTVRF